MSLVKQWKDLNRELHKAADVNISDDVLCCFHSHYTDQLTYSIFRASTGTRSPKRSLITRNQVTLLYDESFSKAEASKYLNRLLMKINNIEAASMTNDEKLEAAFNNDLIIEELTPKEEVDGK